MTLFFSILIKGLFSGIAGLGFAILFNVPRKVLGSIFFVAMCGGLTKFGLLHLNISLVGVSLIAGIMVGILSVPFARKKHTPPLVFAIPGIISMVPGAYIYRTIIGMLTIATSKGEIPTEIVTETIHNSMYSLFILTAISVGAGIPTIITRRQIMTEIKE